MMKSHVDNACYAPRIAALQKTIVAVIPCRPDTSEVRAELGRLTLSNLILTFYNWAGRAVPARPRKIWFSPGFWDDNSRASFSVIHDLVQKIGRGHDLTPYLSSRVRTDGYIPRPAGSRRGLTWGDKDFALNAWDVHHLHLTPKGSKQLLYVAFDHENAAIIMLGDHHSFDNGSLERRVIEARAQSNVMVMKGVLPDSDAPDCKQRIHLARHGINSHAHVGEKIVIGSMLTSSGHSTWDVMRSGRAVRALDDMDSKLDDPALLKAAAPMLEIIDPYWTFSGTDLCIGSADGKPGIRVLFGRC